MRSAFLALATVGLLAVTAETADARPGLRARIAAARARNYYYGGYSPYYGGYSTPYYGGYYGPGFSFSSSGFYRPGVNVNIGVGRGGFMPYYGNYYGGGWRYFRW